MSRKYYESLAKGTGVSGKAVESEFGMKILAKFGWREGDGLGKERDGRTECVQIRRREEGVGLGLEAEIAPKPVTEMWWMDTFNSSVKKLDIIVADSDDEAANPTPKKLKTKRQRKMSAAFSSSEEDTDSDEDLRISKLRQRIQKKRKQDKKSKK
mmetsp:Transcript_39832/g.45417  ORF Transcript_39832/g.45417 Transcript_39832/m.45417 type:complete len:155 (+) Transcript_39832:248-712(+)